MPRDQEGMIQVYTGDGKGKTTAALGMCLRAAGHGMSSHIIQFMKGQVDYGELFSAKKLGGLMTITQGGRSSFVSREHPDPEDVRMAKETLELARRVISRGEADIVVLDEVNVALDFGLIELADVLELMEKKPGGMELVLTGRGAKPEIVERAHLVTEMRALKHYWDAGVASRRGIEC